MDTDFITIHSVNQPELMDVKTEQKLVPKRIIVIYDLAIPQYEGISEESTQDK